MAAMAVVLIKGRRMLLYDGRSGAPGAGAADQMIPMRDGVGDGIQEIVDWSEGD